MKVKALFLATVLVAAVNTKAQDTSTQYLQLNARVDVFGELSVQDVVTADPKRKSKADTVINYSQIRQLVNRFQKPAMVFNELAKDGWKLLFALNVTGKEVSQPYVAFYLSKQFSTKPNQ